MTATLSFNIELNLRFFLEKILRKLNRKKKLKKKNHQKIISKKKIIMKMTKLNGGEIIYGAFLKAALVLYLETVNTLKL